MPHSVRYFIIYVIKLFVDTHTHTVYETIVEALKKKEKKNKKYNLLRKRTS